MTARRLFWMLFATGMALRVLWAIVVPVHPVSDSWAYHQFARNIVDHGVYGWTPDSPTAYWAVGASAAIAASYLVFDGFTGVIILNLIAAAMILVLTYELALRWFGEAAALWSLALVAFWPNLIFFTTILSSELLFIAMMMAGLYFWQRPGGRPVLDTVIAGFLWGLTAYIRPVILFVPIALALVDLVHGRRALLTSGLKASVTILLMMLVALPWTLRNDEVLGAPVMISTNFGPNLWMGNNPKSNGGYMPLPDEVESMGEVERSEYLSAKAKAFMQENPGATLKLFAIKFVKLNARETIGVVWNEKGLGPTVGALGMTLLKLIATGYWYMLLTLSVYGAVMLARQKGLSAMIFSAPIALMSYFTLLHVIVVAEDRYHIPSSPFIAALAGLGLATLASKWSRHIGSVRLVGYPA